ncbi:hypothetical protein BC943DRAFT_319793 [Umbelopsis sp. AD052]|nr:hypothetical protein BC943DRAFT_319793 [Umbelopsis sp. AD052]
MNEYEEQRLKNIERNRQLLQQLDILRAKDDTFDIPSTITTLPKRRIVENAQRAVGKPKKIKVELPPARKSTRLRGLPAPDMQVEVDKENHIEITQQEESVDDDLWDGKLLTADEYFNEDVKKNAIRTDGHFRGWLSEELMKKHGFEGNAADCWEKNGGGKFSYKDPLGTGKKSTGRSQRTSAKAVAHMMWKKNPNMYFYRHNEPGIEQWTGDWTEDEKSIFLNLAKEHGCGDKWGIFASYISHRVGYQCSNFYRSEIIPSGLIFDDNYQFTPSGRPVYVGAHRSNKSE